MRVTDKATGLYHEATGSAYAEKEKKAFGGANAEAESQALRRAFAKFGLGLEMYMDSQDKEQVAGTEPTKAQVARIKVLVGACGDDEELGATLAQLRKDVKGAIDKEFTMELATGILVKEMKRKGIDVQDPI